MSMSAGTSEKDVSVVVLFFHVCAALVFMAVVKLVVEKNRNLMVGRNVGT